MIQESVINRMKSTGLVRDLTDRYYLSVLRAPQEGKMVAWVFGAPPIEMLVAMGIARFHTGNGSARLAAGKFGPLMIQVAEDEGFSPDICSYGKINLGLALLLQRGEIDRLPENFRVPKPDFLFSSQGCAVYESWCDAIQQIFNIPKFVVDAPFIYDDDGKKPDTERQTAFLVRQFQEFAYFLEQLTGKPFAWDILRDEMVYIRELHGVMREIRDLCKRVPAPMSLMDSLVSMGPGYNVRTRESIGFYRAFKAEVEERIAQGIGVISNERLRLGWRSIFPWYKLGHLSRLLAKHGAVLAASAYGMRCYGDDWEEEMPPDGINPDDPLRTIAQEHCLRNANRNMNHRYKWEVERYAREFGLDGVIFHSPRTCRPYAMWNHDMAERAERQLGLPTLVIEADHTDPKYYAEAQLDTRIEAFIESLEPAPRRPGPVMPITA